MSEDSPKIVNLETSLELSEFPSEMDFPSEADVRSEAAGSSPPLSPALTIVTASSAPDQPVQDATVEAEPIDAQPIKAEPIDDEPIDDEPVRDEPELVRASAQLGPATVTEFPVRPHTPAAVALPSLPSGPVSLVELIERHDGFDWREAVAVIRQICLYLRDHSPQAPILLDPRTIQITDRGEVQLLSGQTSSDPLVIQVGRLLRAMLMGKEAPPELRLLLAQATFELPIFESIEDVDRALAQLNKLDEPGPAGLALLRAVAAPPPPLNPDDVRGNPPPRRPILPVKPGMGRRGRSRTQIGSLLGGYASQVAATFLAIAVIGGLILTRPSILFPADAPALTTARAAPTEIPTTGREPAALDAAPVGSTATERRDRETSVARASASPSTNRRPPSGAPARDSAGVVVATPIESHHATGVPPRSGSNVGRPTNTVVVNGPPAPPPRESERRATELLKQGQAEAASRAFDALVMSNPLYEPRDLTPEGLSAFRTSQKLLPAIALRNLDRARAALAGGEPDRALALAKDVITIVDRKLGASAAELREDAEDLVEQAKVAAAAADGIIYSEADADVVPPRALSRQMPVTGPVGVPPNRVGWLDMVIDRDGSVFFVKLTTPLNRHHERMIVSPAKAWRYQPASKNGKPVMYRLRVKVNLPESGTD